MPDPPLLKGLADDRDSKRTQIHTPPRILRRFGQAAFSTRFAQGGSDTHLPHHPSILRHHSPGRHRADDTVDSRFGRAAYSSPLMPDPPLPCGLLTGPNFIPRHVHCGGSGGQHLPHVSRKEVLTPTSPITLPYYDIMHRAATLLTTLFIRGSGGDHTPVPSCLTHPSLVGC